MNRNPDVDTWMAAYDNAQKAVVARIREIILDADPRITETIKWQTPTFVYRGNIASFQPRSKRFASLMFHEGASIPGSHPRLEGETAHGRFLRVADLEDAEAVADELRSAVRAWCDARDAESGGGGA